MLNEGAHPEPLVGAGMAGRRFGGYDPRFAGYSNFGYDEHGYADSMFPRGPYAPPYYGPYGSEGWHGRASYPWDGDEENRVEVPEACGNTFHPRYPPPHFPSHPPPHSYSQPYGGPRAGPLRLPPGPPPVLNDQNCALKGHPDQECDEDGL
jgi:hypothetical protein